MISEHRAPGTSRTQVAPAVLFINGFARSGTTVMTAAVTDAVAGVTTTAGVLARHIPALATFFATMPADGADRGVDRLAVTPQTIEEYGYLLYRKTGRRGLYAHRDGVAILREHIAELTAHHEGATVVLKNPDEMSHEREILRDFPEAGVILLRRGLADIEDSLWRAMHRTVHAGGYPWAVIGGDDEDSDRRRRTLESPWRRAVVKVAIRLTLLSRVRRLIREVPRLAPHRVAFLCYEELRDDPRRATTWAAHLIDPKALANAYTARVFAERTPPVEAGRLMRAMDRRWSRAWDEARSVQIRSGVCRVPAPEDSES